MINFSENLILENEVVRLQPLQKSDFDKRLPFAIKEPDLWTYSLISGAGKEGLKTYIALALKDRADNKSYPFLVIDKRTNQVAGSTRFYDYQPNHSTIQLGFTWYGKEFQGTELNKNCKFLLLELAFEEWNMQRVEFRADANNSRSINAMKGIGCTEEGILRNNCASPTGRRNSIVLSILPDEWNTSVKKLLSDKINNNS